MNTKLIYIGMALLIANQHTLAAPPSGGAIPLFQIPPAPIQPQEPPKIEVEKREAPTAYFSDRDRLFQIHRDRQGSSI